MHARSSLNLEESDMSFSVKFVVVKMRVVKSEDEDSDIKAEDEDSVDKSEDEDSVEKSEDEDSVVKSEMFAGSAASPISQT
ncbi:hypothetical protein M431DRAFT_266 [Trichoderma harzianum CBS 226.95]|uniref:Uncharacterized protein n=1 Tax=Trichoderma harzianum CBS 226.95 TaxID=983964 RepID=A0A2T4ASY2_TRIHA|nr:hypothetical protein M431DRAFT_266 [Trichoderma harzianum CBS 226.95]PTB60166.1 hypothetical protein M431DRAFT_266 [Trichoderma harzianum CBS 226.95]